ncbi:hypothetical protein DCM91_04955 [Chitinophaga costaii]|nr:hypothetical protein DCM91_04955 [Chitinophaga costaii]
MACMVHKFNTGRGNIQGRYRGSDMIYLEAVERFQVSQDGLLGGVVFINASSIQLNTEERYKTVHPVMAQGFGCNLINTLVPIYPKQNIHLHAHYPLYFPLLRSGPPPYVRIKAMLLLPIKKY